MKQPTDRRPVRHRWLVPLALLAAACAAPAWLSAQDTPEAEGPQGRATWVTVDYSYTHFREDTDPWHIASLALGRRTALGSVIGRVNYADRFDTDGVQLEVDAYPRLPGGTYAYLNAGHALSGIFPEWRFGAELFANLPGAWEASLGVRELRFDSSNVTLYTGSVGKYAGNYWISLRPYVRPKHGSLSASAGLTARRYFEDADHYLGARVSYGSTPSDRIDPSELARTHSFSASAQAARRVGRNLFGIATLGYEREELGRDRFRNRVELSTSLRLDF